MSHPPSAGGDSPDRLRQVHDDEAALDRLAQADGPAGALAGGPSDRLDPAAAALAGLAALRVEIDADEVLRGSRLSRVSSDEAALDALARGLAPALISTADTRALHGLAALRASIDSRSLHEEPLTRARRRRHRSRAAVAASVGIAVVLAGTGVAAAATTAHPGGRLYGLRVALIGRTSDDPIANQEVLAQAARGLATAAHDPRQAATAQMTTDRLLQQAARNVPTVADTRQRAALEAQLAILRQRLEAARQAAERSRATTPGSASTPTPAPTPSPRRHRRWHTPVKPHPTPTPHARHTRATPAPHPAATTPAPSSAPTATPTPSAAPHASPTPRQHNER